MIGIDRQENPEQWEITQKIESSEISRWQGFQQDITDQETTAKLITDILNKHSVTGLVNAAGVLIMRSMLEAKTEDWQTLFAVNVMAPIAISQQLAKHFCEKSREVLSRLARIVHVCHVYNLACMQRVKLR